ncbi:DUF4062 domain-containing protein [Micromonospora tulbaghiae]|uniref:DUF4062 domain-containing protein n=1 Tax=Micromonospora tulbaghiae TaxID=479978 RepID=UPI003EBC2E7F
MRVFISSVTYSLGDERRSLARILSVVPPYEPLRFEDFVSQDRSSRDACLAGVEACDVYVLLLGPRYGQPLADSGIAPTEEEFTLAQRLGKPILVFTKSVNEPDEPRQLEFKRRVEHYVNGRFRKSFTDPESLNVAVLAALTQLTVDAAQLVWENLAEPAPIRWRWDIQELVDPRLYAPVLDVHLVPTAAPPMRALRLQALPSELARRARDTGFFQERDQVAVGNNGYAAWAWVSDQPGAGGLTERLEHEYRGVAVFVSGQVVAFRALPTDFAGALVDHSELQRRSSDLLAAGALHLPEGAGHVAVAATLAPLDRVFEGNPAKVGGRTSGSLRTRQGGAAVMHPTSAVAAEAVTRHTGDVAAEIAAVLLQAVRDERW